MLALCLALQQVSMCVLCRNTIPFYLCPALQLFDADLLAAALDLTHRLDARFGLAHKKMVSLVSVCWQDQPAVAKLAKVCSHWATALACRAALA